MDAEHFVRWRAQIGEGFRKFFKSSVAAVLLCRFAACFVDQDTAHRFGGCGEKMTAVSPVVSLHSGKLEPSLMHQRGWLQSLSRSFACHFAGGESSQLVIDQGQQFFRCLGIAPLD